MTGKFDCVLEQNALNNRDSHIHLLYFFQKFALLKKYILYSETFFDRDRYVILVAVFSFLVIKHIF